MRCVFRWCIVYNARYSRWWRCGWEGGVDTGVVRVQAGVAAVAVNLGAEGVRLTRQPRTDIREDAGLGLRNLLLWLCNPDIRKILREVRIMVSCTVRSHEMPLQVNVILVLSQFCLSLQQLFPAEVNTRHVTTELSTGWPTASNWGQVGLTHPYNYPSADQWPVTSDQ